MRTTCAIAIGVRTYPIFRHSKGAREKATDMACVKMYSEMPEGRCACSIF